MTEILVVDDSVLDHAYVNQMVHDLQCLGEWNAEYVASGDQALVRLQERRFDLVLVDNQLPNMNGQQLLLRIQQLGLDTPVIVMSAYLPDESAFDSRRRGTNAKKVRPNGRDASGINKNLNRTASGEESPPHLIAESVFGIA